MNDKPFPSYTGTDPYVFVSYSHKNSEKVFQELVWLREQGFNIWYDEGISPGSRWAEDLARAIKGCYRFLFFVSDDSVDSPHCRNEVHYAITSGINPSVVNLTRANLPDELEFTLGRHQSINYYDQDIDSYRSQLLKMLHNPQASKEADPVAKADEQILAILPFSNTSRDPEDEYLCDGIADELLRGFASLPGLKVASRGACSQFKDSPLEITAIAGQLRATQIIEGAFRKFGDRMRLSISLIDGISGYQTWSEKFDGEMSDVFELQDSIAASILNLLSPRLSPNQEEDNPAVSTTRNLEAYRLYLRGTAAHRRYDNASLREAIDLFQQAIVIDPEFFDAYVELATCVKDHNASDGPELIKLANDSLEKARKLAKTDEQLAKCEWVQIRLTWKATFDVETFERSARTELLNNIDKNLENYDACVNYATILLAYGLFDAALGYLDGPQRDVALAQGWLWSACCCAGKGDFEAAIEWCDVSMENDVSKELSRWVRMLSQNAAGKIEKSRAELEQMKENNELTEAQITQLEISCLYWENRLPELRQYLADHDVHRLSKGYGYFCLEEWDTGIEYLKPLMQESPNALGLLLMLEALHPAVGKRLNENENYLDFMDTLGFTKFHQNRMRGILETMTAKTGVKVS